GGHLSERELPSRPRCLAAARSDVHARHPFLHRALPRGSAAARGGRPDRVGAAPTRLGDDARGRLERCPRRLARAGDQARGAAVGLTARRAAHAGARPASTVFGTCRPASLRLHPSPPRASRNCPGLLAIRALELGGFSVSASNVSFTRTSSTRSTNS